MTTLTATLADDRIIATLPGLPHIEIRPSALSNWMDSNVDTDGVENALYMTDNLNQVVELYLKEKLV